MKSRLFKKLLKKGIENGKRVYNKISKGGRRNEMSIDNFRNKI